ncbi:tRNA (5-methylaminomethyl-2-thiouridine)(34)-methyltransferase MnmD [Phenylobacterium sp.]|jgi:tRNA 5-methylaminomethyl-2-thiouridine biosynthesis bifunctional protein|uniref:tRNA (5-methylaminomethyl-2-thiouridine)(34)-methyltransferase MnmD n=1 Tax=Phenylobacterium sp. TaxID=1871053 RepID=UPI002F921883
MDEPQTPLTWTEDGHPRSRIFGDVYFSAQDGLAETRTVFLAGCGLPEAWSGRRRFTVAELGFGTGLNIAALLDLWGRTREPGARLHVFSVEAHPIAAEESVRALARWPELSAVVELLTRRWPGRARGVHRVDLPELGAILDVAVMDVAEALAGWSGAADAWFLDGFSPALNPGMWRDDVLALVAARSAPGARAATFTVAGQVRRGLVAAGFEVEKRPGYGRKRERLEARLPGRAPPDPAVRRVAVIGGGIAGASAARAVRALGAEPVVIEKDHPGAGGSGNPAALVTPRLDAGLGAPARLFAQAFGRAVRLYEQDGPEAILRRGVRQLAAGPRDAERFAKIAASGLFEPEALEASDAGLDQRTALVLEPAPVLDAWIGAVVHATVGGVRRDGDAWLVETPQGGEILWADAVIVAAAMDSATLAPDLPLTAVRGQASWTDTRLAPIPATAWGGYVLPIRHGLLFGATHDRGDGAIDVRAEDHRRNLETLAAAFPDLAARLEGAELAGRASIRAMTPDRLPLAGAGADGVLLLTGFGSRGFAHAPLLAEHVAALALGAPSPLPRDLAELVDPGRFARRAARRSNS